MLDAWLVALVALLLALTALLGVALLRIRRVDHAIAAMREDVKRARRECESLFPQLQSLLSLERLLDLPKALPATRGWAGSPDFLLSLAEEVLAHAPDTIMECGSGVSTLVAARCAELNGRGHVYSLEHDPAYAAQTRGLLSKHGLSGRATVIEAPLVECSDGSRWYSAAALPADLPGIDLLVVDGPPGTIGRLARYPALRQLRDRMNAAFTVLVDDADRDDEREMIRRWRAEDTMLDEVRLTAEKGLVVLRHAVAPVSLTVDAA